MRTKKRNRSNCSVRIFDKAHKLKTLNLGKYSFAQTVTQYLISNYKLFIENQFENKVKVMTDKTRETRKKYSFKPKLKLNQ